MVLHYDQLIDIIINKSEIFYKLKKEKYNDNIISRYTN
jgi:hypothetical protein